MLPRAVTARVAYVPGTAFFADGFGSGSMRLSYCYPTPERIREGVRRLAGVLEAEMERPRPRAGGPQRLRQPGKRPELTHARREQSR
jgi:2-aminoadipate transaminase